MIPIDLENIFTEDDAVAKAKELFEKVDTKKEVVLVTRSGKPAVALVNVAHLEELSGRSLSPQSTPNENSAAPAPSSPLVPPAQPVVEPSPLQDMPDLPPVTPPSTTPPVTSAPAPGTLPIPAEPTGTSAPTPTAPSMPTSEGPAPLGSVMGGDASTGAGSAPSMGMGSEPKRVAEDLSDMPDDPTNSSPLA